MNPVCLCCKCCPAGMREMDMHIETRALEYDFYPAIKCPVQIFHGAKDDQVDPNCSKFHSFELTQAEEVKFELVEGMGHCQMSAEVFERKMTEFAEMVRNSKVAGPRGPGVGGPPVQEQMGGGGATTYAGAVTGNGTAGGGGGDEWGGGGTAAQVWG